MHYQNLGAVPESPDSYFNVYIIYNYFPDLESWTRSPAL